MLFTLMQNVYSYTCIDDAYTSTPLWPNSLCLSIHYPLFYLSVYYIIISAIILLQFCVQQQYMYTLFLYIINNFIIMKCTKKSKLTTKNDYSYLNHKP